MQLVNQAALVRLSVFGILMVLLFLCGWLIIIKMPGKNYRGPLLPLTSQESAIRDMLRQYVEKLASEIGERNVQKYTNLAAAADFLEVTLAAAGYEVHRQGYKVGERTCYNIEVEIAGANRATEIVIIGGHYDSVLGCLGANDNATGVAALLTLADTFAGKKTERALRFVFFVNEEPPYFQTPQMGSVVYAKRCRKRGENVVAMLSLETIGYYSDEPNSQNYPFPFSLFYPSTGNFIAFVGNISSRGLVRNVVASFRHHTRFPSEGVATLGTIPGIGWSDHWAFWQEDYPGMMVTDTAFFRYPYYHTAADIPDKIKYDRMAQVVAGIERVVADLAGVKR